MKYLQSCCCFLVKLSGSGVVCGTDGTSYNSECDLRNSACQQQKFIVITSKGHCGKVVLFFLDKTKCSTRWFTNSMLTLYLSLRRDRFFGEFIIHFTWKSIWPPFCLDGVVLKKTNLEKFLLQLVQKSLWLGIFN